MWKISVAMCRHPRRAAEPLLEGPRETGPDPEADDFPGAGLHAEAFLDGNLPHRGMHPGDLERWEGHVHLDADVVYDPGVQELASAVVKRGKETLIHQAAFYQQDESSVS